PCCLQAFTYTFIQLCIAVIYVALVSNVFFFNATSPTHIYTLSLHDALPISISSNLCSNATEICCSSANGPVTAVRTLSSSSPHLDRKSTRLNSSHSQISYAVFCLKKKNKTRTRPGTMHRRTLRGRQCQRYKY